MKNTFYFLAAILSLSGLMCICSCGEPEEPVELMGISSDFEIIGKWNFQSVSGDGVIFGVPQSSEDNNPTGYVEFMAGGVGYSDFSLELLSRPFELQDSIVWSRPATDTIIVQAITEGKVDVWHIIGANNAEINAEWPIDIAGNTATLNAKFEK